jgi:DNA modification methylase
VAALVEVFRGVWRVLRDDGLLFIVLGDSYWSTTATQGRNETKSLLTSKINHGRGPAANEWGQRGRTFQRRADGLKPKDLCGIPWRVAFALQDDGWILRQECIWAKPNPMPESVKDRCTRAHETVFMLAKGPTYYYDAEAIREPHAPPTQNRFTRTRLTAAKSDASRGDCGTFINGAGHDYCRHTVHDPASTGRNKRSVWSVATSPLSSKKFGVDTEHYAAFPPDLVRPMIRAGCPPDGVVLDPFCGSGTTGLVAVQEGRRFWGCDLNSAYVELARRRIATAQPRLLADVV